MARRVRDPEVIEREHRLTKKHECMGCGKLCFTAFCDECVGGTEPFRPDGTARFGYGGVRWNGVMFGRQGVLRGAANPRALREDGLPVSD